jgi:hypothetical protein
VELDQYCHAVSEGITPRLTVSGKMSELLSAQGNPEAAIALESLWNTLTDDLPFLTLCWYASSCFHDGASTLWSQVCARHSVLSHARDV